MTVSECKKQVLRLLDEVGVSDYDDRIYKLIDEAQRVIACTWGFIRKKITLHASDGETVALPEDCYAIEAVRGGSWSPEPIEVNGEWKNGILLNGGNEEYVLTYKAYPDTIEDTDGNKTIQLAPEYHTALCCYTAALTQHNEYDKRAYQLFMGRYNDEMALVERARRMTGKARVVVHG